MSAEHGSGPPELSDLVYTATEAARILKVTVDKCRQLVREGHLIATRISPRGIRISREEMRRFIDGGSAKG